MRAMLVVTVAVAGGALACWLLCRQVWQDRAEGLAMAFGYRSLREAKRVLRIPRRAGGRRCVDAIIACGPRRPY